MINAPKENDLFFYNSEEFPIILTPDHSSPNYLTSVDNMVQVHLTALKEKIKHFCLDHEKSIINNFLCIFKFPPSRFGPRN